MKENTGAVHAQVPVDVATYLLNEKRAEFHAIESRLKVNVVLIPNIHLETPNYTVARLRHDELNQSNAPPPSYEMANIPEKPDMSAAQAEPPAPRQQAMVKAITPAQPAPVVEPKPSPGQAKPSLIGRIFSWFKGNATTTEKTAAQPARASATSSRRGQPPRREQRGRANNSSEQRWQQRDGQRTRNPDRNQQRQQQRDRPQREAQPQRPPRSESAPSSVEGARTEPLRENGQRREGAPPGRRRRGGRRGRHEVRETQPAGQDAIGQIPASIAATPADVVTAVTHPPLATTEPSAFQEQEPQKELSFEIAPVVNTPFPAMDVQAPTGDDGIAPSEPFPAAEEPPERAIEAEPAPLVTLDLTPTNLVQIETSAEKARAVSNHVEPPPPLRPPRVRPSAQQPAGEEEPLVQIETQK